MTTVRERFKALGLAHSNKVLSVWGMLIAAKWRNRKLYSPTKILQDEDGREFFVNAYPDDFIETIDRILLHPDKYEQHLLRAFWHAPILNYNLMHLKS